MDFSFVDESQHARERRDKPPASTPGRPLVHIPSAREVYSAETPTNPSGAGSLFKPKGLSVQQLRERQQQPPSTGAPPALVSPPSVAPAPSNARPAIPNFTLYPPAHQFQQQQQQQQQQPPNQQQPPQRYQQQPSMPQATTPFVSPAQVPVQPQLSTVPMPHHHPQASPAPQQQPFVGLPQNALVVSKRQAGNPILKHIRNVRWTWGDIVPDYLIGASGCALFLSLRYHLLQPEYIMARIKAVPRNAYALRILLVWVDVEDAAKPLGEVTKSATLNDFTVVCAWSAEECARYLEIFKAYEHRPATAIQERLDADYVSRLSAALCAVRGINRTDAVTLGMTFGSLAAILTASAEELGGCPGIGPTKVARLAEAFHLPFKRSSTAAAAGATKQPAEHHQQPQSHQQQQQPQHQQQQQQQPQRQRGPSQLPQPPAGGEPMQIEVEGHAGEAVPDQQPALQREQKQRPRNEEEDLRLMASQMQVHAAAHGCAASTQPTDGQLQDEEEEGEEDEDRLENF